MATLLVVVLCAAAALIVAGVDAFARAHADTRPWRVDLASAVTVLGVGVGVGLLAARRVLAAVAQFGETARLIGEGAPPIWTPSGVAAIDAVGRALVHAAAERSASLDFAQEAGGIGAWSWNSNEDAGHVTKIYKQMHGLEHIEGPLSYDQLLAAVHPEERARFADWLAEAASHVEPWTYEYRVMHRDGTVRWIAARGRPLDGADGQRVGCIGIVRDITAEREAAAAVRDSRAQLALAAEAAKIGVWDWDLATGIIEHSPRARAICSLEHVPEIRLEHVLDILHPEDRPRLQAFIDHANDPAHGEAGTFEHRIVAPTGDVRWVQVNGRMMFEDSAGQAKPVRFIGTVIDVTERKAAEDELRRLNDLLEHSVAERTAERDRLWTLSRDAFVITDDQGVWIAASPAWTALLGWSEAELLGRTSDWILHPDDLERTRAQYARLAEGRVLDRFECRLRGKEGAYRWLSWTGVPEGDRFYLVARDVTAEREQARALKEAEAALRQAQKMESIGQITGGVAHDFNNLLTPIVATLDILHKRGLPDSRAERMVGAAIEAAERARTLVARLLAFARRQPLQASAVDVARLVEQLKDLLVSTLGPQVRIVLEPQAGLPPALADFNQLELALLNLAVNARDAMPKGGEFRIATRAETIGKRHVSGLPPGRYVRIEVQDTGVGMAPSVVERAVEPFFSTKGTGKGTGLGLSMVHGLTAQLGGGMQIESAPGAGTVVHLWLPLAEAAEPAAPPRPKPPRPTAAAAQQGVALLVDDDALVRESAAQMLSNLGWTVLEADSAARAFEQMAQHHVDVLVTDHLMPGVTGTELARAVRERDPAITLLIISGYADVDDIAPDLPRLSKPFREAELADALARARAVQGAAPPVEAHARPLQAAREPLHS